MADPAESPAQSPAESTETSTAESDAETTADTVSTGSTGSDHVPPVCETSRLRLRPWREDDGPGPGEGPDRDSLRFMPAGAQPGPDDFSVWLEKRRRDMEAGSALHWCIADLASDVMLGNIQIFMMEPQDRFQGELGYWLRPGARGRGFIGEAIGPVLAHAFTPAENQGLGLTRLHAATNSDNYASAGILLSAGFTRWGVDHQAWRRPDGSLSDGIYFELLAASHAATSGQALDPITVHGHGIRLRKWRHTDAAEVVAACSDARTRHWLAELPSPYTPAHAQWYFFRCAERAIQGTGLFWCVADSDSDRCLGAVAIEDMQDGLGTAGEIGYWAGPDARGRGVISEAVRLAVRHAFLPREDGGLGRQRLQLLAADGNAASQHVAAANNFVEVGRDRRAEPLGDGTFVDLVRFDLLVQGWNDHG